MSKSRVLISMCENLTAHHHDHPSALAWLGVNAAGSYRSQDPIAHAHQASAMAPFGSAHTSRVETGAVVTNGKTDRAILHLFRHRHAAGLGVFGHIVQGLLDYAKPSHFNGPGQAGVFFPLNFNRNPGAFGTLFSEPPHPRHGSDIVQDR